MQQLMSIECRRFIWQEEKAGENRESRLTIANLSSGYFIAIPFYVRANDPSRFPYSFINLFCYFKLVHSILSVAMTFPLELTKNIIEKLSKVQFKSTVAWEPNRPPR